PMDAEKRAAERRLDRCQREIDVELALGPVDEGEAVRRFEGPDGRRVEEHEALLPARHHPARTLRPRRAALEKTLEALLDALLGERLQDIVDYTEIERFQAVLRGRGRQHEHRCRGFAGHRADQVQARARVARGGELDVDEDDVHGRAGHRPAGFLEAGHRADHFSAARVLDQLDQVVPRRPLVLEHQYLEEIRLAHDAPPFSSGSSTTERVPPAKDSSRSVAASEYRSASRRRTDRRPNAPGRVALFGTPGPLSSMVQTRFGPDSFVRTVICPPPARIR